MPSDLLDGRELAERIGCPQEDIMRWHRMGRIPSIKTRHRVYFNLDLVIVALRALRADKAETSTTGEPRREAAHAR